MAVVFGAVLSALLVAVATATGAVRVTGGSRVALHPATLGLPQETITALARDRHGFLWIGTLSGLARWDGYEVRSFYRVPGEPYSLAANEVRRLAVDGEGTLWVETAAGVQRFRGASAGFGEVLSGARLVLDGAKTAWALRRDGVFRLVRGTAVRAGPLPGWLSPRSILSRPLAGGDRGLWLWLETGRLARWNGTRWRLIELQPRIHPNWAILAVSGRLWVASRGTLWECREADPRWRCQPLARLHDALGSIHALSLARTENGALWVGGERGAWRISSAGSVPLQVLPGSPENLPSRIVRTILPESSDTVLLGTVTGLWRCDAHRSAFEAVNASGGFVTALMEDGHRHLWIGSYGNGVDELLPSGAVHHHRHREPGSSFRNRVWALAAGADGEIWAGSDGGLDRLVPESGRFEPVRLPWHGAVTCLATDPAGRRLWAGLYEEGVVELQPRTGEVRRVFPSGEGGSLSLEARKIRSLLARDGTLWIGTEAGLYREPVTGGEAVAVAGTPETSPLASPVVWEIVPAGDGALWLATRGGLDRLDPVRGTVRHVLGRGEIPGGTVYRIERDRGGSLWLSTNHGLVRYKPGTGRWTRFGAGDDLPLVEFNRGASCALASGTLAFGGNRGLVLVHPERIQRPERVASPVVARLTILEANGWRELEPPAEAALALAPAVRAVRLTFARPVVRCQERVEYRVRMDGGEAGWIRLGSRRTMTLARSGPRKLEMAVQASISPGPWSTPLKLHIRFLPSFWERQEVRWGGLLLAIVLAAGLARSVVARRYRHRLALARERQRLIEERERISRDLHDEIGAGLTSISLLSELIRRPPEGDAPGAEAAGRVGGIARGLLEALDTLIWAVDPRHDTLEATVALLREHAVEAIEAGDAVAEVELPDPVPELVVPGAIRRTVLLVMREAVANALRHGGARRVTVRLGVEDGMLRLRIEDDGCGFEGGAGRKGGGHGLRNMAARAASVGGSVEIESAPGRGTAVTLVVPLEGAIPPLGD